MRALLAHLRAFLREDFHAGHYAAVALFLALAGVANYATGFKRSLLNPTLDGPSGALWFALFYALPYYFAAISGAIARRDAALLRRPAFWGASAFAIAGLVVDNLSAALPGLLLEASAVPDALRGLLFACLRNLDRTLAIALPVWVARVTWDRGPGPRYGMTWRGFDPRPYALMLAVCAPLVAWASFRPAFLAQYPGYRGGPAEEFLGAPLAATGLLWGATRAARFVTIELFFRGFLVLGFTRHFGRAAVLPMVALYTFWHFGKPPAEAAASALAAWVLAVLVLRTRSVAGGVLLHIAVALAMETAAFLQLRAGAAG